MKGSALAGSYSSGKVEQMRDRKLRSKIHGVGLRLGIHSELYYRLKRLADLAEDSDIIEPTGQAARDAFADVLASEGLTDADRSPLVAAGFERLRLEAEAMYRNPFGDALKYRAPKMGFPNTFEKEAGFQKRGR